jgi:hypothetical protein
MGFSEGALALRNTMWTFYTLGVIKYDTYAPFLNSAFRITDKLERLK